MFGLPSLTSLKNYVIACVVAAILGAYGGYRYEHAAWQADTAAKLAEVAKLDEQAAILQQQLDAAKSQHALTYLVLKTEVLPNVNLVVESPGQPAKVRPKYYFTHYDLCLWNDGLFATDPAAGSNGTNACAGPADAYTLTSVDVAGLYANALLNFQQYADCRATVQTWQQWYLKVAAGNKR